MEIKKELKYLESHEWFDVKNGTVGISDYAQGEMGDVVFVELPEVGDKVEKDKSCATVESVKAVFDIISPVSGEVVEVNGDLADAPEKINENAFASWFFKVKVEGESEKLMDADSYAKICK